MKDFRSKWESTALHFSPVPKRKYGK